MIRHFGLFIPVLLCAPAALLSWEWLGFFMAFTLPLVWTLRQGWTLFSPALLGLTVLAFSYFLGALLAWEGFQTREMRYAFIGLGVAFLVSLWRTWLQNKLSASYMSHDLSWYEGRPRSNVRVHCEVEGFGVCKVARFDREGVFVFPLGEVDKKLSTVKRAQKVKVNLGDAFGSAELDSKIMRTNQGGMGLRFNFTSMDQRKKLGDLVERFQGAGNENS